MSQAMRLSEKWFKRALWLVAVGFAYCLIQLGSLVVDDLPGVPQPPTVEAFLPPQAQTLKNNLKQQASQLQQAQGNEARAQLQLQIKQAQYNSAHQAFQNWLATRQATQLPEQNQQLLSQTQALDQLKAEEQQARSDLESQQKNHLLLQQQMASEQTTLSDLGLQAQKRWQAAYRLDELKVFAIRLALTLPLLWLAGWLFAKKRQSASWPFVWGFIGFACYTFFVELVPYLPEYGGYVRYSVGVALSILLGRYLMHALQRYLATQKAKEQLPESERHQQLSYDLAQKRLSQGFCPGCERPVDVNDSARNFCIHCGICLFKVCEHCHTRKSAFGHYCHHCGQANG